MSGVTRLTMVRGGLNIFKPSLFEGCNPFTHMQHICNARATPAQALAVIMIEVSSDVHMLLPVLVAIMTVSLADMAYLTSFQQAAFVNLIMTSNLTLENVSYLIPIFCAATTTPSPL